jgi:hypothetical protein
MATTGLDLPHDFPDRIIRATLRQPANLRELFAPQLLRLTPVLPNSAFNKQSLRPPVFRLKRRPWPSSTRPWNAF